VPHGLANRPGEPYPAAFRKSGAGESRTHYGDFAGVPRPRDCQPQAVEIRRIELRLRPCHGRVIPFDHIPAEALPRIELDLPRYRRGVPPEHFRAEVGDMRVERNVSSL
jgi:hypothetical protein